MKQNHGKSLSMKMLTATLLTSTALFTPRVLAAPGDYATYADAYNTGINARAARDYVKSRDGWESAIALAEGPKQKASALLGLAQTALDQNQLVEAQKLCQDVLAMQGELNERLNAHLLLASVYRRQGKSREAAQEMKEVQRLDTPRLGVAANGKIINKTLAIYGSLLGDVSTKSPEQIRVALEALVKDPKTPTFDQANALSLLGDIALEAQQRTVARDFYTRAIDTLNEPRFFQIKASFRVQLGNACAAEGDWKAARQAYESALPDIFDILKPLVKAKRDAAARAETQNA